MPVRLKNRGVRGAGCLAALTLLVAGCSLGGESEGDGGGRRRADGSRRDRAGRRSPEGRVGGSGRRRLRRQPTRRSRRSLKGLPAVVERGWPRGSGRAAGNRRDDAAGGPGRGRARSGRRGPGRGDGGSLRGGRRAEAQAFGAKHANGRPPLLHLMAQSEEARRRPTPSRRSSAPTDAPPSPRAPTRHSTGLAAVRWADRASQLCLARDRAFASFRPTDIGSI